MIQLLKQIKWQFLIFHRNNLVTMIIGIVALYVLLIYMIRDFEGVEKFVTLLIYNDPAVIGFVFIGISIMLEKDQQVLPAIFVTPLNLHFYLISRIVALSTIVFVGGLAMLLMAKGTSFNILLFFAGTFSTGILFCLMGIFVASYTTEILHFMLRSIPLLILMSLPLLNYFGLTDLSFLNLFPVQGGLNLMVNSYREQPDLGEIIFGCVSIAVWTPLLYWAVYRTFVKKIVSV
jgi:fluoroquinolone transport system permease protein